MEITSAECLGRFFIRAPLITLNNAVLPRLSPIIILFCRLSRSKAVISPCVISEYIRFISPVKAFHILILLPAGVKNDKNYTMYLQQMAT